jgi:transcriptional regulator with GAF, ATPase, and Fis domain
MGLRDEMWKQEQDLVLKYLEEAWGNMALAARMAGMQRRAFWCLVQKHGIDPNVFKRERTA